MIAITRKHGRLKMHRMHTKRGWIVWCFHQLHKVFEIWPFLTPN
jgi:hypothetical protein